MAHFALLNSENVVIYIFVGRDDEDEKQLSEITGMNYKKTSYNTFAGKHKLGGTPFRKNYAGLGMTYDETRDAFIPTKPGNDWVLDDDTCRWIPPQNYIIGYED
jgi:hypothetical protein